VAIITALITSVVTIYVSSSRGKIDARLTKLRAELESEAAERRAKFDKEIAEWKAGVDKDAVERRHTFDERLAGLKAEFDQQVNAHRLEIEHRTLFAAERVARELMSHDNWQWRSFKIIQAHLGGFEANELRKILVRAGAIRVKSNTGQELWGLIERNKGSIGAERLAPDGGGGGVEIGSFGERIIQAPVPDHEIP
jgi:hypothetical protein